MRMSNKFHAVIRKRIDTFNSDEGKYTSVNFSFIAIGFVEVAFVDLDVITQIEIALNIIVLKALGHFQGLDSNARYSNGIK